MFDKLIQDIDQINLELGRSGQSIQLSIHIYSQEAYAVNFGSCVIFNSVIDGELNTEKIKEIAIEKSNDILEEYKRN